MVLLELLQVLLLLILDMDILGQMFLLFLFLHLPQLMNKMQLFLMQVILVLLLDLELQRLVVVKN